jgi:hypothetical protein
MNLFTYKLTAAAIARCSQLNVNPCVEDNLVWKWMDSGGFCGEVGCNWVMSCPNDYQCSEVLTEGVECHFIATYPTIGSLVTFERDGTLDGEGGKKYLCHRIAKPCEGDPNKECALMY